MRTAASTPTTGRCETWLLSSTQHAVSRCHRHRPRICQPCGFFLLPYPSCAAEFLHASYADEDGLKSIANLYCRRPKCGVLGQHCPAQAQQLWHSAKDWLLAFLAVFLKHLHPSIQPIGIRAMERSVEASFVSASLVSISGGSILYKVRGSAFDHESEDVEENACKRVDITHLRCSEWQIAKAGWV